MKKYIKILNEAHNRVQELQGEVITKLEFISNDIFDFTTYDSEISEKLASDMIEVLDVIINKRQLIYFRTESNYLKYLTMVNMPFLTSKLNWGTSIHSAWIESDKDLYIYVSETNIENKYMPTFIHQMIEWVNIKI